MRISDWSSDVCSSDLPDPGSVGRGHDALPRFARGNRSPDRPLRCGSPCGEYSMKKFPFLAAAAALFLAVPLAACGGGAEGEDKPAEAESHAEGEGEADAEGLHGGKLLKNGDFAVDITIFANGTDPQYRVFATRDGTPVDSKEVKL